MIAPATPTAPPPPPPGRRDYTPPPEALRCLADLREAIDSLDMEIDRAVDSQHAAAIELGRQRRNLQDLVRTRTVLSARLASLADAMGGLPPVRS